MVARRRVSERVRVFIGVGANHEDIEAQAVLEYTLKKHSSLPVDITWMRLSRDLESSYCGWDVERWGTPYEGFKWAVPSICGHEGRAIYIDCDFIVKGDIAELWREEMAPGKIAIARVDHPAPYFNFCLWDCAAAKKYVDDLTHLMSDLGANQHQTSYFAGHPSLIQTFAVGQWCALDTELGEERFADGIRAYHCSRMNVQPYMRYAVPRLARLGQEHWFTGTVLRHPSRELEAKFDALLREARHEGFVLTRYTKAECYGDYGFHKAAGAVI